MADIEPTEAKASPFSIPRETTPAWESELLLSIGLVVAMLQLSPALDGYFEWWQLRVDERWYMPLMFAFLYSKSAVVALILTFVTHLTARGFWVALVGVRAVFPSGIDWSKVRQGPVAKALAKQRVGDVGAVIERLDNFASLAFAVGFLIVTMTLSAMVVMVLCTLLSGLLAELIFDQNQWWQITTVCLGILFLPLTVALLVDGFLGKRLAPGGRAERLVRMGFRSGAPFFNHPWSEAIMLTLTSGVGALRTALVLNLLLVTVLVIAAVQLVAKSGASGLDDFGQVRVEHSANNLNPKHYADQRKAIDSEPYVPAEAISGRYLRLFIPFRPRVDRAQFELQCPDLPARVPEGKAAAEVERAVLACAAKVYAPRLNDVPVPVQAFAFGSDAVGELRGFVVRVDLADVADGRQLLTVQRYLRDQQAPAQGAAAEDAPGAGGKYFIAFWREP